MLRPEFSGQFKKDYKKAVRRDFDPKKLLCSETPLPDKYQDHVLVNSENYKGMRECHIESGWLLVYKSTEKS